MNIKAPFYKIFFLFDNVFEKLIANLFIWFFFAILYFFFMEIKDKNKTRKINFKEALYFSATSHYTIGFGDYTPVNDLGRALLVLHIFSSWFISLIPYNLQADLKAQSKISPTTEAGM